jgi:hypothetical protein
MRGACTEGLRIAWAWSSPCSGRRLCACKSGAGREGVIGWREEELLHDVRQVKKQGR